MNFDENAQVRNLLASILSSHTNHLHPAEPDIKNGYYYREKLCTSYSTPIANSNNYYLLHQRDNYDDAEQDQEYSFRDRNQFLKEISQVRQDIVRLRTEMNGLAKQMDGMEIDLNHSKDRVHEIEKGLTATQEVNVNLQVLLERAVNNQRESDVHATRAMRHIHTNLATVVYETGQLRGRLTCIANYQKQHQGNVSHMAERMREYTSMLEQAQGTIQSLKEPSNRIRLLLSPEAEDVMNSLDIKSNADEIKDRYKHRIIRKRASNPEVTTFSSPVVLNRKKQAWLPQKGLRILLNDYHDGF
ncbi:hypothetical protein MAM1_0072d04191 [Mucor ambiguus]|uniref:Uncharacterized protein n=1 Tax=Mucor ambiguus TaxID=91626 RepID=A0A0C9MNG7_9FUNG|nr:hypothetical protein MAM1_0072d04191 [Mucor ambiguus]